MVSRDRIAIALRAREGINFLLQTRGLDSKAVVEALRLAATALSRFAESTGRGDEDRVGDTAPAFAFGEIGTGLTRHGLRVLYRRVSLVWVLVVTPVGSSSLAALQVLEQVTRICVAAARSPDVTPEKLTKKFPEVYLALAAVLARSTADPSRTLAEAELEAAALAGSDANKGLAAKAAATVAKGSKLTNILSTPFGSSSGASTARGRSGPSTADDSVAPSQSTVVGRRLADETEPLAAGGFQLPADAFARVPVAEAESPTKVQAAGLQGTGLEYLAGAGAPPTGFEPPAPTSIASPSLVGTGLEGLVSPPATSMESPWGVASSWGTSAGPLDPRLFGGLTPPVYAASSQAQTNPWGAKEGAAATVSALVLPAPSPPSKEAHVSPSPPKERPLPVASPRDAKAIARGRGLLLVELWRASFVGPQLVRAGLQGEVVGTGKLSRSRAHALYRLAAPTDSAATVTASLRAATLDPVLGERGQTPGAFVARLGAVSKQQAVFLRYRLPAIACPPPLLLSIDAVVGLGLGHAEPGVLLLVQFAVSPALPGPLRSATLDVDIPEALCGPSSVAPHGQWSAQQRRLRWRFEGTAPGDTLVLCASFRQPILPQVAPQPSSPATPKSSMGSPKTPAPHKIPVHSQWQAALAKAAAEARAALCFVGPPEATLSGIRLSSGTETDKLRPLVGARCAFHGEVTARPMPVEQS